MTKKASRKQYPKRHNDRTIWAKGTMVNGVTEGHWGRFRKNGSKMRSGYFKNGKQTGKWSTYDKKGKVYKVTDLGKTRSRK